ncbi:hypothetical protein SteCoe_23890 [Stentor coeruleus]|uniref:Uncharacterized protein n=1 Tax=Stentor coeruleus TaxID=5963 RepID=A0A1R2BIU3_9CILI|nr:hypothetical protein SteCoe_23890 [Stentor coeruleus]
MVSMNFSSRFKNKIEKLGRDGIPSLVTSNAIDKTEIPTWKIHQPLLRLLPSNSKVMISQKGNDEREQDYIKSDTRRSNTPINVLPQIRISPIRIKENASRSKSPLDLRERIYYTEPEKIDVATSCPKLPRINSSQYSLKSTIKHKSRIRVKKYY